MMYLLISRHFKHLQLRQLGQPSEGHQSTVAEGQVLDSVAQAKQWDLSGKGAQVDLIETELLDLAEDSVLGYPCSEQ